MVCHVQKSILQSKSAEVDQGEAHFFKEICSYSYCLLVGIPMSLTTLNLQLIVFVHTILLFEISSPKESLEPLNLLQLW